MDALLTKIADNYAYVARDRFPRRQHPVHKYYSWPLDQLSYLYREDNNYGPGIRASIIPRPWSKFTRSGMFSLCLKHFFLSLSFEDWYLFFAEKDFADSLNRKDDHAGDMTVHNKSQHGPLLHVEVFPDGRICARPRPSNRPGQRNRTGLSPIGGFIEYNSLAAWNMAMEVPQGQSIVDGCEPPTDPEAGSHTLNINENLFPAWPPHDGLIEDQVLALLQAEEEAEIRRIQNLEES